MKRFAMVLFAVYCCVGCDRERAMSATGQQAGQPEQQQDQPAAPVQPDAADADVAGNRGWELDVSGVDLPAVSGAVVMAMNMPGGVATYRFASGEMMGSIDLRGVRVGETGVFEPYNLQFNFLQPQWTCGMSSLNPDQQLEVEIRTTATGYRGTFAGDVKCKPAVGGKPRQARVQGWFEK